MKGRIALGGGSIAAGAVILWRLRDTSKPLVTTVAIESSDGVMRVAAPARQSGQHYA